MESSESFSEMRTQKAREVFLSGRWELANAAACQRARATSWAVRKLLWARRRSPNHQLSDMNRDAMFAELLELEALLQAIVCGYDHIALHEQALRHILESDAWHPSSQTF
jgi:hypothetical protein